MAESQESRMDRIAVLLEELSSRTAEEREAWLESSADPALRGELRALAAANDQPGVLDQLESMLPAALRSAVAGSVVPDVVGEFEVEEYIGAGGMGEVYRARRRGMPGEPQVALKILRARGLSQVLARRFDAERRILAHLDHPAIPRFIDGGVTPDGIAYIAMEYVDGIPIHRWCREHQPSLADRVRLVIAACDAIQYAHQRLIVHRDVKSSNILVELGAVKVLDFGIARMLDDDVRETTATGHRWMTPSYASPEQIRGEQATTASDVYSLGVVLYELLCGRLPHTGENRAAIERSVLEEDAEAPSDDLRAGFVRGEAIPIDLDTVVLKALAKEPERRYATAVEFADDLRRFLGGLPVRARPDTARYRARKFVRRNRAVVVAGGMVVAALLLGTVATTLALLRARETARREAIERARAEATSRFVVGLFAGLDPMATGREGIPARELLDSGAARLEREFRDQPQIHAVLLDQLGTTYEGIGRIPEAVRLNSAAVAAQQRADPPDSSMLVRLLTTRARLMVLIGQVDSARSAAVQALSLARAGGSGARGAEQLRVLADAFLAGGDFDSSETYLARAVEAGRSDTTFAWRDAILSQRGGLLAHQRNWVRLGAVFDSIVALRAAHFGMRHPQTALAFADRAENTFRLDRLPEARADLNRGRSLLISVVGSRHPYVATTEFRLGRIALRMGDLLAAESLFAASANTMSALYGASSTYRVRPLIGLGESRLLLGRLQSAEASLREAISISSKSPINKRNVALATSLLGRSAVLSGQPAKGERLQREAYAMLASPGSRPDSALGVIAADLAMTLRQRGKRSASDSLKTIALAVLTRMPAESSRVRRLAPNP